MPSLFNNAFTRFFFYGNYFYGLCTIALSVEAMLQQRYPLNRWYYFVIMFCLTVVYYTKAYITDSSGYPSDERNRWYAQNKTGVKWSQVTLASAALVLAGIYALNNWARIKDLTRIEIFLFGIFPLVAALYYGVNEKFNIRRFGWLKPFIIGFSWAGIVTWYPVMFYCLDNGTEFAPTVIGFLLFLKNFMFVSVLCIMFDIKDYASDAQQKLNTFIVRSGLRKTIFFIIIPLCLVGLGTFVLYGISRQFHPLKITFNVLPFVLLILVAYSLHTRRSLLYYLVVVDGLMLVKAICGTVGMVCF
jgi:hypothetical protein